MVVLERGAVSYERGTPVPIRQLWRVNKPTLTKSASPNTLRYNHLGSSIFFQESARKLLYSWICCEAFVVSVVNEKHTYGTSLGGVPREQKMFKGHLPRVIYHQVYQYTKITEGILVYEDKMAHFAPK